MAGPKLKPCARAALAAAMPALLGACGMPSATPGTGGWQHSRETSGDVRSVTARLEEDAHRGALVLTCSGIVMPTFMDEAYDPVDQVNSHALRYRFDGGPIVARTAQSNGAYFWFHNPQSAVEDPFIGQLAGKRRLLVQVDWAPGRRGTYRYDLSHADEALRQLRQACAQL